MKKYFFFAACASVAFASCVNDVPDAPVNDEQHAITFDVPVVQPNSRTQTEVGTDYENGGDYMVTAWWFKDGNYKAGDADLKFMDNIKISKDNNKPEFPYFYPKNGTLTFIAYSPANLNNVTVDKQSGITITDYVADGATGVDEQDDILFSERRYNMNTGTVSILFNHALSSIRFAANTQDDYTGVEVKINSIKLENVRRKGTFYQKLDDADGKYTKTPVREAQQAYLDGNKHIENKELTTMINGMSTNPASWTASEYTTPYSYSLNQVLTNTFWYPTGNDANKTDYLFIPQAFDPTYPQTLVIDYNVDIAATNSIIDFPNQEYVITFAELHDVTDDEWKMGYRYTYNITIKLDEITFEPSVEAFLDASESLNP